MAAVPVQLGVGRAVSRERSLQGIRFPHSPHGWDGGEASEQKVEVEARPAGEVFPRGLPQERNGLQLLRRENDAAPDRSPNDLPVRTYRECCRAAVSYGPNSTSRPAPGSASRKCMSARHSGRSMSVANSTASTA